MLKLRALRRAWAWMGRTITFPLPSSSYPTLSLVRVTPFEHFSMAPPLTSQIEIPSNYILSKFERPSIYLGGLVVCWGIIMTLTGVVKDFGGLCATRFLLGIFECAHHPSLPVRLATNTLTKGRLLPRGKLHRRPVVYPAQNTNAHRDFLHRQRRLGRLLRPACVCHCQDGRARRL